MFESHNDPVDVLTAFLDGKVRPLRFRWKGRVIRVRAVTGEWSRREGHRALRYYAVQSSASESFELCYDPGAMNWVLCRAWSAPR
jgi:hypothetical protein